MTEAKNRAQAILEAAGIEPDPPTGDVRDFVENSASLSTSFVLAGLTALRRWLRFGTDSGRTLPELAFFQTLFGSGEAGARALLDAWAMSLGAENAQAQYRLFEGIVHAARLANARGIISWTLNRWKLPSDEDSRFLLQLPLALHERLRDVASKHGLSMAEVVRTGTEDAIARLEQA